MQLRVGPFTYRVRLVAGYIDHGGQRCLGLCDNEQGELLISDRAGPRQRLQILGHEYMEAWLYHFGGQQPGKEDYCDLLGLALTQLAEAGEAAAEPAREDAASPLAAALTDGGQALASAMQDHRQPPAEPQPAFAAGEPTEPAPPPPPPQPPTPRFEHRTEPVPGDPASWRIQIFEPG